MNEPSGNGRLPPDAFPDDAALDEVRGYLGRWRDPDPDPAGSVRLLTALKAEMKTTAQSPVTAPDWTPAPRRSLRTAWLIYWSQTRVIHKLLWLASALIIGLGGLVSLTFRTGSDAALPLTIVAPLVAAIGIALLYGGDSDPAIELILSTPVSPRVIVLARLSLVFGFNLLFTVSCSLALVLFRADLSVTSLVLDWLAPMTLLSGLAFLLSALLFDPLASGLLSFCLWAMIVARHFDLIIGADVLRFLPDLLRADLRAPMIVAGIIIFGLALLRIEHEERWTNQHA